ncbi:SUMF1/EgtB/PvdO family nonheme iron enzyme [uncultured Tateyamaria sp.]|uniref:formylglycine-generating enzyme family protein n=1 Tax=uncultured Tateyamaria sp. TaxID=455651 RepID=UPI00260CE5F8|nr:SUMF1/EgtB/PvdO family nonheme iron enzyme [uncultured Tateyamaria sp.]
MNISSWNKNNLLQAAKGSKSPVNYYHFDLYADSTCSTIHLNSAESLPLGELLEVVPSDASNVFFLNVLEEGNQGLSVDTLCELVSCKNHIVFLTTRDEDRFLFSLFCECINFCNVRGISDEVVDSELLFSVLTNISASYQTSRPQLIIEQMQKLSAPKEVLWTQERRYSQDANMEHFERNSATEHIQDATRRLMDCAFAMRRPDFPIERQLVSSEGLFQLAQVGHRIEDDIWIEQTRFFQELHPGQVRHGQSSIAPANEVSNSVLKKFVGELRWIPSGEYTLGTRQRNTGSEPPAKSVKVNIPGFYMSKYPVTERFWSEILETTDISSAHPKTEVTFFDAYKFCELLNGMVSELLKDHGIYGVCRIPTEGHWEAAARGPKGLDFPWGNSFKSNHCNCNSKIGGPTPVGSYSPRGDSPFGVTDMSGNVREWTMSYAGTKGGDDWSETSTLSAEREELHEYSRLVVRGGSYVYYEDCVYTWMRNTMPAGKSNKHTGFRIAVYI